MLMLIALLAQKFNKRVALAFTVGLLVGGLVLSLLLANHLRQVCNPLVAGLFVCKVS